MNLIMSS